MPDPARTLAKLGHLRSYKPGKYGKGLIQSEAAPQAMVWRVGGGWNGEPHHAEVSDVLKIHTPNVAFHIDKAARFYFHASDPGFVHPKDPAALAAHVRRQYPELRWGKRSAEDYERAHGLREANAKTLAVNGRPLRPFEQGAHLHVLDWTHSTVRQRFQAAGAVQVKAAAKAIVGPNPPSLGPNPPSLPALQAAIHGELRNLYALGHATVRSELDHQRHGRALPIGLSKAPEPPGLRIATKAKKRCGTCHMFDASTSACWGYGNWPVEPGEVCDSWARETVRTLAATTQDPDPGRLHARAALVAASVAHQIHQAIGHAQLLGITDRKALRRAGREAGSAALGQAASRHAGGAIASGRHAAATNGNAEIIGARYTSVLDKNTCGPCADADTGELIPIGDPRWIPTPNPACLGGGRCRCIHVYQLAAEAPPRALLVPDDFPAEPRQPDRPSGVSALPVAAVGVGSS